MLAFWAVLWYNTGMEKKKDFGTSNREMVTISRAEYDADKAYIAELEQQRQWLMEQLKLLKRKQFGSSSEKASEEVMEQMSLLFDEAEACAYTEQKEESAAQRACSWAASWQA